MQAAHADALNRCICIRHAACAASIDGAPFRICCFQLLIICLLMQFAPGPGSRAITVSRLKSWYHWWRNVVLTTDPVVAAPLPVPPRQTVLSTTTRASPLVQAVHSADDLRVR
jgi:hypothetical protein